MNRTSWTLSRTSLEAWESFYADCERATKSIDLEMFIFEPGGIGDRFIELFKQKALMGVKIRMLLDMVGSRVMYYSTISKDLQAAGVEIHFFNPAYIWRFSNFTANFFRTHRKLLIIDNHIAHLGGINIGQHMKDWRDTNIRVTGELVEQAIHSFDHMWKIAKRKKFRRFPKFPYFIKDFAVRTNSPHFGQRFIYRELVNVVRNAQKSIYLTTPYFIPDFRFFRVLRLAAKRGVDVKLLVPQSSDHFVVDLAAQSHYGLLMKAGVKIFAYTNNMLHAKTVIVDNNWATVGSLNLDNLSFSFNYEANVSTTDRQLVQTLTDDFNTDLQGTVQLSYEQWHNRSWLEKILELCTWPFHRLL